MAYTASDEKTIIHGLQQEVAALNQRINRYGIEDGKRSNALTHVRLAMDEAIAMATRFATLPVSENDKAGARRRSEAVRLAAFFRESKQNFESELAGNETAIAEKVVLDELTSVGDNVGKGTQQGSAR